MSAGVLLQAAAVAALKASPGLAELTGVFDANPVRSALPHAVVDDPALADWSTKTWAGREARLVATLHDAGERPTRLRAMIGELEAAIEAIDPELGDGWRIATVTVTRSRIARAAVAERWIAVGEFRVRMWRDEGDR